MTLTRRGVVVVAASLAVAVLAWLFGLPETAMLSAAALGAVAVAAVTVAIARPDLTVHRSARPGRVRVGDTCEIHLSITNSGRRRSPVVTLSDQVSGFGRARLAVAPIAPGSGSTARYSLPTSRRGVQRVGPLTITSEDAFGLVVRRVEAGGGAAVMVLPRTWQLTPLAATVGEEPEHGSRSLTSSSTVDEEFAALREYVSGDDIRRIHWPSTARLGSPVVRQFDVPWQRRTTVVVDLRAAAHDDLSFERTVSAAASVIELAAVRDELVRLVTTDGADSGFVPAASDLDELTDRLAVVEADHGDHRGDRLVATLEHLRRTQTGRPIVCAGAADGAAATGLAEFQREVPGAAVVLCGTAPRPDAPAVDPTTLTVDPATVAAAGAALVRFDGTRSLSEVWIEGTSVAAAVDR